ncbi:PAS domain-containing protein [Rhizobium halophilum]|uniref:PAS domain-containing protein n=1 Tax=Rhizobium halophilum TaxID=2846852 RepID=UPI001EFC5CA2|nr:PAS domain-containing protein [Rhizobium halophilum]MCF6371345.1 PAS domain-containing protein [Rhizobium halophilum]
MSANWSSRSHTRRWVSEVCAAINIQIDLEAANQIALDAIRQHPMVSSVRFIPSENGSVFAVSSRIPPSAMALFMEELKKVELGMAMSSSPLCDRTCPTTATCISIGPQSRDGVMYFEATGLNVDPILASLSAAISASLALNRSRIRTLLRLKELQKASSDTLTDISKIKTDISVSQEISKSGTFRWDSSGEGREEWSDEVYGVFGFDKERDRPSFELLMSRIHPDDLPQFRQRTAEALKTSAVCNLRYRIVRPDGSLRYILSVARPEGHGLPLWSGMFIDLTDRHEMERAVSVAHMELTRMSRLMTVGQLGASIAHELNQPLTSMVANAGATLRWLDKETINGERVREGLTAIASEAKRASNVIKGLQGLARKSEPRFERMRLDEAIEEVLPLISNEIALQGTRMRSELSADDAYINADRIQIQQIVLALMISAWVDNSAKREKLIMLATKKQHDQVTIVIGYNGVNLRKDLLEAKQNSTAAADITAQGLSINLYRSIIEAHGGVLTLDVNDAGTSLKITLPIEFTPSNSVIEKPEVELVH